MKTLEEIKRRMQSWITFLEEQTLIGRGYCSQITADLGDILSDLKLVEGWNPTCFQIWEVSFDPQDEPWAVNHVCLAAQEKENYIIDIPMKEYAFFDYQDGLWKPLPKVTFNLWVIKTWEDLKEAFWMPEKDAKKEASRLENAREIDLRLTPGALEQLSDGRYRGL